MPKTDLSETLDPQFPDYVYAARPLVKAFANRSGRKAAANLLLGEWMKVMDERIAGRSRVHVRFRGGEGYVEAGDVTRMRHLEIFFIDVDQGDAVLIQTPEDRRILVDAGESDDAHEFIRNKYRLDKPDNYIDLDAVVATHSDADHSKGLLKILADPKIAVKRFYHNGLFRRTDKSQDPGPHAGKRVFGLIDRPNPSDSPGLAPLMKKLAGALAKAEKNLPAAVQEMKRLGRRVDSPREGFVCQRLDAAQGFLPPYDDPVKPLAIAVLWPRAGQDGQRQFRRFVPVPWELPHPVDRRSERRRHGRYPEGLSGRSRRAPPL